jgi:hypothetical protein
MFDHDQLKHVIDLQDRAYRFVLWASRLTHLHAGHDAVERHAGKSTADAADEWISRNFAAIPPDVRPERHDIHRFATLVAGLLQTSFSIDPPGKEVRGRPCEFCSMLGSILYLRNPNDNDRAAAHALKMVAISTLTDELDLPLLRSEIDALINAPGAPAEDVAWITYAQELLRRSEFASQGTGVLQLWRDIAWENPTQRGRGRIKDGFSLTAERVLLAQQRVKAYVTASTTNAGGRNEEVR